MISKVKYVQITHAIQPGANKSLPLGMKAVHNHPLNHVQVSFFLLQNVHQLRCFQQYWLQNENLLTYPKDNHVERTALVEFPGVNINGVDHCQRVRSANNIPNLERQRRRQRQRKRQ